MVVLKNRYIIMEILWLDISLAQSSSTLTSSVVNNGIKDSLQVHFGDHELGCLLHSLQVRYVNPITGVCLVRCSRQRYQKVWGAMTYISSLRKHAVLFNLLHLSGNVRATKRALLKYDTEKLRLLKLEHDSSLTPALLQLAEFTIEKVKSIEG